jgi:hypothetical protein
MMIFHPSLTMKSTSLIICFILGFSACNVDNRVQNAGQLANEIKSNQVKRVTNTQINEAVQKWGEQIVEASEKLLLGQIAENNANTDSLCANINSLPFISAIEKEYHVEIDLLNQQKAANSKATGKEKELIDAYLAASAQPNTSNSENIQQINDSIFVYSVWLSTKDPVCQQCFGDDANPFALWKVAFNKKDVIRRLNTVK